MIHTDFFDKIELIRDNAGTCLQLNLIQEHIDVLFRAYETI